ncbi:MAG: threonine--tRNA ligase [Candidatus Micrarchaeota archaeon]|nr:threonine--tRNA ligase [Candidatus Micrarchaeota archaeon]
MRILQLDVDEIRYELIKPEAELYDEAKKRSSSVKDAVALLVSAEDGDDESVAKRAMADTAAFMERMGRKNLVIFPFAHLSSELSRPKEAMEVIDMLYKDAGSRGIVVEKAPFGWNKSLGLSVKGHPLAEQGRTYRKGDEGKNTPKKPKVKPQQIDLSIVRKSDFAGLPETDHRVIGERLDLFSLQEVSPGMVYWHRKGHMLYRTLLEFLRDKLGDAGYEETSTPALANIALWHVSGHIDHYKDNMFMMDSDGESMGMKPMNCPSTMLIYKARKWSYRDLPWRASTFDHIYRNELSGALSGLFRVREVTMDDAHIFIREDQLQEEMHALLGLVKDIYSVFGFEGEAGLSTMPDDHMGDEALWEKAEAALKGALEKNGIKYKINPKEGAFYGPKIDFHATDSIGRKWQLTTIQLDYQLPNRFGLSYTGEDGKQHTPVVIHRAILGSLERFMGILLEHYNGKLPTWLSPVQAIVVTISEPANKYALNVVQRLRERGMRAEADISDKTLQYKIRDAQLQKIPYIVVVGKKEEEANTITIRARSGKQKMGVMVDDFVNDVEVEILERKQGQFIDGQEG